MRPIGKMYRRKENHKICLLHLVHSLRIGGAEIALCQFIKALGSEGYEHHVYCFNNDGPVREKLEALGIPVYMGKERASIRQPFGFAVSLLSLIRDLQAFIRTKGIQLMQSHSGEANQLGIFAGKLSGVPTFPTVHSTMAFVDTRSNWDPRVHLVKGANAFIYRAAERVLAVSHEIKEIVRQSYHLPESRVMVLKNGIVIDNTPLGFADLKQEFPGSRNKLKLIAVGRLVPLKCFDILVQAAAEVVNQGFDNLLVMIAGEGEELLRLENLIEDLKIENHVKLLGLRHDVMDLMKACDLFVLPSRYEGLSIAMIEAMACGLPIIASDAPGLRDHIKPEQNGLLFPVENHKALAERILQLANDKELRYSLSCGAKRSFEREYDMRENIKPLDILFRKCAANS